ncbi:MAG TPA: hypothetical protein VF753_02175 [Terriglobales bacterium]
MAALPNELAVMNRRSNCHFYHADADVFNAVIEEPVKRRVDKQAFVRLPKEGGYDYRRAEPLQVEGLISYRSGYTQVAGNPSAKHGGVSTLATSVIEDLNVLDVLTADRVVGQIFTEHPEHGTGQVPSVSFLGTRFENLRIAGHKIEVEPVLDILGPKPDDDGSYFDDNGVIGRVERQYSNINAVHDLPEWAAQLYTWDRAAVRANNELKCSLFNRASLNGASGTRTRSFGHVIDLPFFGKIFLGELAVSRVPGVGTWGDGSPKPDTYLFHLTMIRLKLGCPTEGSGNVGSLTSNGQGSGGDGGGH